MKKVILMLALVGCSNTIPPRDVTTVTVTRIAVPAHVYGKVIDVEEVDDNPYNDDEEPVKVRSTWMTGEELQKLLDERHEARIRAGLECRQGDPLCSDLQ